MGIVVDTAIDHIRCRVMLLRKQILHDGGHIMYERYPPIVQLDSNLSWTMVDDGILSHASKWMTTMMMTTTIMKYR
jgi:hypothetical protein